MASAEQCRVYEQDSVFAATGPALHPGGLALTGQLVERAGLPAGAAVLDAGCGAGATADFLRRTYHLRVTGLDYSAKLLRGGRAERPHLSLVRAPAERLPLAAGQFEAVLAECSLSVMAHPARALAEFGRVLRPGGLLMVHDIYARRPEGLAHLRGLPFASCLRGAWLQTDLMASLTTAGFEQHWWADCSAELRRFAGRLIFAHGSMAQFWSKAGGPGLNPQQVEQALAQAKPGYFSLIAEKKE